MNEAHFVSLLKEHQAIVHKVCRLYRDTVEDREDLFQEIIFQLWKSYPSFRSEAKFSTWIYRIALNTAISTFRKKQADVNYVEVLPDLAEEPVDENLVQQQQHLLIAMKQLNSGEKAIIMLLLDDFSYQQIAEITGISENYVGVKINRIKTKLKQILNSYGTK